MALTDPVVTLAWLVKIELPSATLRLCDGGLVNWSGEVFASEDPDFGTIGETEAVEESSGDQVQGHSLTFLPKDSAAAATISQPEYQNSPIRFWLAEVDPASGNVVGTPSLLADMLLDTTEMISGRGYRRLEIGMITRAERLFLINEGNTLSPTFHQSVWPGETGLDNATGVALSVAWGVVSPPRGTVNAGSGGGIAGANATFKAFYGLADQV